MNSLENHSFRISFHGKDAFHSKDVLAFGAEKLREPSIEFLSVAVSIALDADAGDFIVMMMVVMLVLLLEEVRVDFHRVIEVESTDVEHFGEIDLRVGGAMNPGHGIHAAEARFKSVDFCG